MKRRPTSAASLGGAASRPGFFSRLLGLDGRSPGPANPPSRYPPSPNSYEGVRPEDLLASHPDKLGGLHADFAQFYGEWPDLRPGIDRLLLNVAAHVQQLPASRAHHHSEPGGLFAHILEVALIALHRRHEYNPRFGLYGGDVYIAEVAWPLSVLVGALLHDIAKPAYLMRVFTQPRSSTLDQRTPWNPYTQSLYAYMQQAAVQRVFVEWLENRGNHEHDFFAAIWLLRIVPSKLIDILYRADPRFLFWIECFLTDRPDPLGKKNILAEVVRWADQRSAREDVESQNISYRWGLSESVSHVFRTFATTQPWSREGAMFWLGALEHNPDELAPMWIVTKDNLAAFRAYAQPFFPPTVGVSYDGPSIVQHLVAGGIAVDLAAHPRDGDAETGLSGVSDRAMPTVSCRVRYKDLDHRFQQVLFLTPSSVFAKVPDGPVPRLDIFGPDGERPRRQPITVTSSKLGLDPSRDERDMTLPTARPSSVTAADGSTSPAERGRPDAGATEPAPPKAPTPTTRRPADPATAPSPGQPPANPSVDARPTPSPAPAAAAVSDGDENDEDDDVDASGVIDLDDGAGDEPDPFAPVGAPVSRPSLAGRPSTPAPVVAPPSAPVPGPTRPSGARKPSSAGRPVKIPDWRFLSDWTDEHDPDELTHLVVAFLLERAYRENGGNVPDTLWGASWRALCVKYKDFPQRRRIPFDDIAAGHREFMSIMRRVEPIYQGFVEDCWPSPDPRSLIACQRSGKGAFVLGPSGIVVQSNVSVNLSDAGLQRLRSFMRPLHPLHADIDVRPQRPDPEA